MNRKNEFKAINRARKLAKKNNEIFYIVYEDYSYHVASEYDMDTFFFGARPLHAIDGDGNFYNCN